MLVTEMFQVKPGCAPDIMKENLEIDNRNHNFRHESSIKQHNFRSVYYGNEKTSFIGTKTRHTLPGSCKDTTSLKSFKENTKWGSLKTVSTHYARFIINM